MGGQNLHLKKKNLFRGPPTPCALLKGPGENTDILANNNFLASFSDLLYLPGQMHTHRHSFATLFAQTLSDVNRGKKKSCRRIHT
jgi:hypothetical protein